MNGSPKLIDALEVIERAVAAAPLAELPALLGAVEQIKVAGWGRMFTGPQNGQGPDVLLTVPEVAAKLKLSEYRTYELCRQGILKSVRLGKSVRVKPSAIAEYLVHEGG
jgi:excisionase family DNA binding protein